MGGEDDVRVAPPLATAGAAAAEGLGMTKLLCADDAFVVPPALLDGMLVADDEDSIESLSLLFGGDALSSSTTSRRTEGGEVRRLAGVVVEAPLRVGVTLP